MAVGAKEKMAGLQEFPDHPGMTQDRLDKQPEQHGFAASPWLLTDTVLRPTRLYRLRAVSSCTNSSKNLLGNFGWR